jgi:hypothetical protein
MAWAVGPSHWAVSLVLLANSATPRCWLFRLMYLVPPTAPLMAWLLFGEPLLYSHGAGALSSPGCNLVVRLRKRVQRLTLRLALKPRATKINQPVGSASGLLVCRGQPVDVCVRHAVVRQQLPGWPAASGAISEASQHDGASDTSRTSSLPLQWSRPRVQVWC